MKYCYIPNIETDDYILGSTHDISGKSDKEVEYHNERILEEVKQFILNKLRKDAENIRDDVHRSDVYNVLSHYEYDENDEPYVPLAFWTKDGLSKLRADEACPIEFAIVLSQAIDWNDKYSQYRVSDAFSKEKKI
ncbi:MAG: hypothetical protein J7L90_00590 [Dehalococcoidia bacterium]|nr:hypothetical protein [Dehalococcoidia bacterium]